MLAAAGSRSAATLMVGDAQRLPFATVRSTACSRCTCCTTCPTAISRSPRSGACSGPDGIALHLDELGTPSRGAQRDDRRGGARRHGPRASGAGARVPRLLVGVGRGRARTTFRVGANATTCAASSSSPRCRRCVDYVASMTWLIAPADGNAADRSSTRSTVEVRAAIARDGRVSHPHRCRLLRLPLAVRRKDVP